MRVQDRAKGETFAVTFAVKPAAAGDVTATGGWSSTGYVVGGNNSHGDAWGIGGKTPSGDRSLSLTATYNASGDFAGGFGNTTLTTQASNNKQSAKLTGLPPASTPRSTTTAVRRLRRASRRSTST